MLLVLLLLGIAGAAGLITWYLYPSETTTPSTPPPRPVVPRADLIVEPPVDPVPTTPDAGPGDADVAGDADAQADAPPARTGPRRPGGNRGNGKTGTVDRRRVSAFIRSKQGQVRRCYERRLKQNNALQGVLDTQIRINRSGRVTGVTFTQDTLYDNAVRTCVATTIRRWQFPEPAGGGVTVSNLFRFAPRH